MRRSGLTMKFKREFLKRMLNTNPNWAIRALMLVYSFQTDDEQVSGFTSEDNKVGFSGAHAEICSSFAEQYEKKGWLSEKQMTILFKTIPKYWKQVLNSCDEKKLINAMRTDGVLDQIGNESAKAHALSTII